MRQPIRLAFAVFTDVLSPDAIEGQVEVEE